MAGTSGAEQAKRRQVLLAWHDVVEALGHPTPQRAALEAVAEQGAPPVAGSNLEAWRTPVSWLLEQLALGVHEPLLHMPDRLWGAAGGEAPAAGAVGSSTLGSARPAGEAFEVLRAWRTDGVDRKDPRFESIKDTDLRLILQQGSRTEEDIRTKLRGAAARDLAAELARVLDDALGAAPAAGTQLEPTTTVSATDPADAPPFPERAQEPGLEFAEHDFSEPGRELVHLAAVHKPAKGVELRWAAHEAAFRLYRVVSDDHLPPYSPDLAAPVAVVSDPFVLDPRPFTSAVRYYQVWTHEGADLTTALDAQPVLHAGAAVVSPVQDVDVRDDEGRVIGQWSVWLETDKVHVMRIPVEQLAQSAGDQRFRILAGQSNLGGFVDTTAERGQRYVYQVLAESVVDGVSRLSAPVSAPVSVSAVLSPVQDLAVTLHDDGVNPQFDLTWTSPPSGRVVVFRTEQPPIAGVEERALLEGGLQQAGLTQEARLAHPIDAGSRPGTSAMTTVPWPREWTRTYFTPVTLLDGRAHVGRHTSATRTGRIEHQRIVERTHSQVLTFAWPPGAASVLVYRGPRGQPPESATSGTPEEISAAQYIRLGGLRFAHLLPATGCAVHLVPVAFAGGEKVLGAPVAVDYPGLLRLHYDLSVRRPRIGRGGTATLRIWSEIPLTSPPPFVLVHNADRLPLSVNDGSPLHLAVAGDESAVRAPLVVPAGLGPEPGEQSWVVDVKDLVGYVRLFAHLNPARAATVAVLDPPVGTLLLGAIPGRRR